MLETSVPLCMRTAREEILAAMWSCNHDDAEFLRQRAHRILRGAVREFQREAELQYDWSLLRFPESENSDAKER